jgi:hypothetical protein
MNNLNKSEIFIYRNYILIELCHLILFVYLMMHLIIYKYPLMQYRI